jgi:cytochrome c553
MNKWLVTTASAAALWIGGAHAAGDPEAGQQKATPCAACHGVDGNSPNPVWPKLAGQHPQYIRKQIQDYKSGARQDPLMSAQAGLLATEEDVADVAAYFSGQPLAEGAADPTLVELGGQIYRGGNMSTGVAACAGCHGPAGLGNPLAAFPRLSGQHADYVSKALKDFRSGSRANDPNGMMRGVAARMTDKEIEAVAQYIQGLTL